MTSGPDSSAMGTLRRQAMLSLRSRRLLGRPVSDARSMTWPLSTAQGEAELVLRSSGAKITLECRSHDPLTARSLRAALVADARLVAEPHEHHVLATLGSESRGFAKRALRETTAWATTVQERTARSKQINGGDTALQHLVAQGIWYDRRPNFGDAVGPWLVATMTGKEIVNVRKTRETPSKARGRATLLVGSIIQMLNRHNVDIWGSGLMRPLSQEQVVAFSRLRKIRVRAVRGTLTADELRTKLGWEVPEVYGDPALLLPRFLPVQTRGDHITVVPHLKHRNAMTDLHSGRLLVADVREDLETVVAQIASARACISTSLHGIIVAQAYGVPWLWLNVTDSPVDGRDFKFDDFFTTIDSSAVAQTDVPLHDLAGLDFAGLAEGATLPELRTDLDLLEAALPIRKASQQRQ
ncbi:polysaccharide pyruvyl transferase family protein [Nesterenkonia muleiensis]|uniref:polysaccharide pyruvyl transferase family protein n=1 Tax=Nesterenkonia muleiensis TaxID=2282648 RepID=UPI000E722055|nr:polysaccharide pyruvyl transferase family protein [Nesterenkonia muleiensis]